MPPACGCTLERSDCQASQPALTTKQQARTALPTRGEPTSSSRNQGHRQQPRPMGLQGAASGSPQESLSWRLQ
ncbi:MAG TPA: hypothetical protein VMY43_03670 [Methanothrix sp.]|nr:hypothetical protein [Methanothrix sp.]